MTLKVRLGGGTNFDSLADERQAFDQEGTKQIGYRNEVVKFGIANCVLVASLATIETQGMRLHA